MTKNFPIIRREFNNLLNKYENFAKRKMSETEKLSFARYLINLYNKSNSKGYVLENKKVLKYINTMKNSRDIHDISIGVDSIFQTVHGVYGQYILIDWMQINFGVTLNMHEYRELLDLQRNLLNKLYEQIDYDPTMKRSPNYIRL